MIAHLRHALRSLRREPLLSAAAIVCLALGVGPTTAMFSVVDAVLLDALPFPEAERLVSIGDQQPSADGEPQRYGVSAHNFDHLLASTSSFEALAANRIQGFGLDAGGEPERLDGAAVTGPFFDTLGVEPRAGRTFAPDELVVGGPAVVVLGHGQAEARFGDAAAAVGRTVLLDGVPHDVVGVMPPGFDYPMDTQLWVPLALDLAQVPQKFWHNLDVFARLAPGVSVEEARSELEVLAARLAATYPDSNTGWDFSVMPLLELWVQGVRSTVVTLLVAVSVVLLIACFNVAGLLLARSADRRQEMAVRAALGAGRGELAGQALATGLVLAALGAILGVVLAALALPPLLALAPTLNPNFQDAGLDGRVLLAAVGITLLTGLLVGVAPALRSARTDLQEVLQDSGRGATGGASTRRLQDAFVVVQVAVTLVLLVAAGLMIRSFQEVRSLDPGFETEGRQTFRITLPEATYGAPEARVDYWRRALAELSAVPGVASVAATSTVPLGDRDRDLAAAFSVEGQPPATPGEVSVARFRMVSPGFFETLGIEVLEGREFRPSDDPRAPGVLVVSESMAEEHWPGRQVLGQRIKRGSYDGDNPWLTVVGVVPDVQDAGLQAAPLPTWYLPQEQNPMPVMTFVVEAAGGEAAQLMPALRQALRRIDGSLPLYNAAPLAEVVGESLAEERFRALLLGLFAGLALALAGLGLYGVIAYAVSQSRREFGIRLTFGARRADISRQVLGRGLRLTGLGLGLGVLLAFAVHRWLASEVATELLGSFEVGQLWLLGALCLLLLAISLAASWLPARRAMAADPAATLRME